MRHYRGTDNNRVSNNLYAITCPEVEISARWLKPCAESIFHH